MKELIESGRLFFGENARGKFRARMSALAPDKVLMIFFSCSSMPRNRELLRVFKDVGLVEQLGSGMSRILKAYQKDIFEISEHFIKVVFPIENVQKMPIIANGNISGDQDIGKLMNEFCK